jgi:quercetin dioxygenase-like cupin family protein
VVPESPPEPTEFGLLPQPGGWYVVNAREARWRHVDGGHRWPSLEPPLDGRATFPQLGIGLARLEPGVPMAMYHWEVDQEDFLLLAGEALLIIEGEERQLRAWDFVHCPPGTSHVIVGAGDGPCLVVAVGSREKHTSVQPDGTIEGTDDWGAYTVAEAAIRHGAGVEEETTDASVAYARVPDPESTRYEEGFLPW